MRERHSHEFLPAEKPAGQWIIISGSSYSDVLKIHADMALSMEDKVVRDEIFYLLEAGL